MVKEHDSEAGTKTYSIEIRGWYRVTRNIIRFLVFLLARVEIRGLEHAPDKGPYLMITNHLHWLDPPLVMLAYPYRSHVFAAEKWEVHWFLGPFMRSLDSIFVQRGEVDRKALRQAMAVLEGGGIMGLAPEGTRSKTGALQRGRSGAAYMAFRAGVPLVPIITWGQEKVFASLRRFRRPTIFVVIAPPFSAPEIEGKASAAQVHEFSEEIMYRIAAILPPEYRGVYADLEEERPDLAALYAAPS
jgi:1-acyl-sn-glycerol-3-phosphate acyltransferase